MTFRRLLRHNLLFHWRANLAVFLGVVLGTAVLTGALLVGDSLRGSLRDQVRQQLGWVDGAMVAGRFFRAQLADDLERSNDGPAVAPAILLRASAATAEAGPREPRPEATPGPGTYAAAPPDAAAARRVSRVTVWGVDGRFWRAGDGEAGGTAAEFWRSAAGGVVINQTLADDLGVAPGQAIAITLQRVSAVPRESLLGRRDTASVVDTVTLPVRAVLADRGPGRFSLTPSPEPPRNAFVPLGFLQSQLRQPGRANVLLVAAGGRTLAEDLHARLTLEDWGLVLHDPDSRTQALFARLDRNRDGRLTRGEWRRRLADSFVQAADRNGDGILTGEEVQAYYRGVRNYLSLESRQMLLEPAAAEAARTAAAERHCRTAPTLVYLANTISDGKRSIPYSIIAALDPAQTAPLGPFLPRGVKSLNDDEIVLADWAESPLRPTPGDRITVAYFEPELEGRLRETTATLRFRGYVPLAGPAADADLTPEFPGITDKLTVQDWDPPFPYDNRRVGKRDEEYWDRYRTTPKAYVTLAAGQRLWGSRFGNVTSIRLAPPADTALGAAAVEFRDSLLRHLDPDAGGFVFDPVRQQGLAASAGSTSFDWLFLGFSAFLILAALLLVALLFRLNLDRRGRELGLLMAVGFTRRRVRRLVLAEGTVLAAVGGLVGLGVGLSYAWLLLHLLRVLWPVPLERSFLRLHPLESRGLSFLIGYIGALAVSLLTILWSVRALGGTTPRALLAGESMERDPAGHAGRGTRWSRWVAVASAGLGLPVLASGLFVHDPESQASAFFGGGMLLLTAGLAAVWAWMHGDRRAPMTGQGVPALARLGVRNAARHPVRSLLTVGLLASAVFVLIAVESFHRDPGHDVYARGSGTGGFTLVGEADVPIFQDLNSARGRDDLNFPESASAVLADVHFIPLRLRAGDDASCLNLFQPRRPRVLGVPHALVDRGGFQFQTSEAQAPEERANPWRLLERPAADEVPAVADANTAQWILRTRLGGTVEVPDEQGRPVRLRLVGLLSESIFQSQLLISEANFLHLYPHQEGYNVLLAATPPGRAGEVKRLLDRVLADHGFTAVPAARRLEAYLAVENTYLLTFQALGGLGLLLGALGLAVVLLRTTWERRGELALLRALGLRRSALGWLVFSENGFLLILGLAVGIGSALLAVLPHQVAAGGQLPVARLAALMALVLATGLAAGAAGVAASLRAPLLPALRRE